MGPPIDGGATLAPSKAYPKSHPGASRNAGTGAHKIDAHRSDPGLRGRAQHSRSARLSLVGSDGPEDWSGELPPAVEGLEDCLIGERTATVSLPSTGPYAEQPRNRAASVGELGFGPSVGEGAAELAVL